MKIPSIKNIQDYCESSDRFLAKIHNLVSPLDKSLFLKHVDTLRQGAIACFSHTQDVELRNRFLEDQIVYDLFIHLIDTHYTTLRASIDDAVETLRLHGTVDRIMEPVLNNTIYWFLQGQTSLDTREVVDMTVSLFPQSANDEHYVYWWSLIGLFQEQPQEILRTIIASQHAPWVPSLLRAIDGTIVPQDPFYGDIQRFLPNNDITPCMP